MDQLRELFGRTCYSHKTQEKAADIILRRHRRLKNWQIGLAAFTTGGLITVLLGYNRIAAAASVLTSTALLALNTYLRNQDLGELSQRHADVATQLWNVREKYLSLLADLNDDAIRLGEARRKRDEIQEDLTTIYANAPRTPKEAYEEAQEALQLKEELTFVDAEIDAMLPASLRKARSQNE